MRFLFKFPKERSCMMLIKIKKLMVLFFDKYQSSSVSPWSLWLKIMNLNLVSSEIENNFIRSLLEIECQKFSSHHDVQDWIWTSLILVSRLLLVDLCFSSLNLCDIDYLRVDHHIHRHPPPWPSNTNQQSRSLFVRSCGMPTAPQLSITRCTQQPSAPAPTVFYCFCRL